MEVELFVYDLSQGLARQLSLPLTGVQIDAIYHTSVVVGGVEYFFGQGVHRKVPGSTHHGRPMKVLSLGKTELPLEVITEYVQSLEPIYTPESYDLFLHNCNNFSQDMAMFLVGKSIPEEIRTLPETFLRTPMGQMVRSQLDESMRRMTQAPDAAAGQNVVPAQRPATNGVALTRTANGSTTLSTQQMATTFANSSWTQSAPGRVHYPQNTKELDQLLEKAKSSCAVLFFTSATCPPCKIVYPAYDELAAEAGDKAVLIKVDVSKVYDIAMRYQVRATPTFMTLLKGQKDQEWSGADAGRLRGNVRLLVQMAHPQHAHTRLKLPSLHSKIERPIMYTKAPPLDKLVAKIGPPAQEKPIQDLVEFIKKRTAAGPAQAPLPDLRSFGTWFAQNFSTLPDETHFAIIDLVRAATADPRVSSYLTEDSQQRTLSIIFTARPDLSKAPYNIQAVTLQLACNLFGARVFQEAILHLDNELRQVMQMLSTGCLFAQHDNARSLAAAIAYNLAAYDHNERVEGRADVLDISAMSDLEAALIEAIVNEEKSTETLHSLLLALGMMLYCAPQDSSIWELCQAMEVGQVLREKSKSAVFAKNALVKEVGMELLGKGYAAQ